MLICSTSMKTFRPNAVSWSFMNNTFIYIYFFPEKTEIQPNLIYPSQNFGEFTGSESLGHIL